MAQQHGTEEIFHCVFVTFYWADVCQLSHINTDSDVSSSSTTCYSMDGADYILFTTVYIQAMQTVIINFGKSSRFKGNPEEKVVK